MLYTNKVNQEQKKNNILFIVYYNIRIAFTLHCRGSLKKTLWKQTFSVAPAFKYSEKILLIP